LIPPPGFTAKNTTVFSVPHVSYSLSAAACQSSIVIGSGLVGQAVVDVQIAGGLTRDDVIPSRGGCAFNGSSVEGTLTYVCRDLPIGSTDITFSANKTGARLHGREGLMRLKCPLFNW
jgi:hypothetical protein